MIEIAYTAYGDRAAGSDEWQEIYSETGTRHLLTRMHHAAGKSREQALCGFHIIGEPPAEPIDLKDCEFCMRDAKLNPGQRMIQAKA